MKRLLDIIVSFIILICFLPIGLLLAISILVESKGGVFYKQKRVGLNNVDFFLFKFRSMRPDSDKLGKITVGDKDPRITKTGYFIRKYKLDEFPQFINVLKGEMSIVGPRPEVREYVNLYTEEQKSILSVKPGITDYASIEYFEEAKLLAQATDPNKLYIEEIMPAKLILNQKYIQNPTILHDFKIMWLTFKKIINRR